VADVDDDDRRIREMNGEVRCGDQRCVQRDVLFFRLQLATEEFMEMLHAVLHR
jgi:hypothetical protein